MHAPNTEAFRIYGLRGIIQEIKKRRALKRRQPTGLEFYRYSPVVTIWHADPETDGSDDSCGYSYPNFTEEERNWIKKEAEFEHQFFFGKKFATLNLNTASCYEVIFSIWKIIRWRFYREDMTIAEMLEASDLASNPTDNLRHLVYAAKHDAEEWRRLWVCIFRCQKRFHRKWYQKPKWHVHHWQIRFDFVQSLKRRFAKAKTT